MPDDSLLRPELRPFRRVPPAAIGPFEVRARSNELAGQHGIVRLRPRLMDVLLRLAASAGEVVTRQALLDDVWPRRLVADEVLSRTIAELRTALDDDAREARYIETLPKIGYRLIAPVTPAPAAPLAHTVLAQRLATADAITGPPRDHAHDAPASAREGQPTPSEHAAAPPLRRAPAIAIALGLVAVAAAFIVVRLTTSTPQAPSPAVALQQQLNGANAFSSDLAMETGPRFSPDASRVVFALGDSDHAQIVVQDVATRTRVVLGDTNALRMSPVFFPDGQRLAYYRRQGTSCAIVERNLARDDERVLVDCAQSPASRFDLAPDGSKLVFATSGEGDSGLRVLDVATGHVTPLTTPDRAAGNDLLPRFSPDGRRVAFVRGLMGFREVWLVSLDDPSSAHAIGSPRGLTWGFAWMGNDGPLLVSADWTGSRALHLIDIATAKVSQVGGRGGQFPDVSAHGDIVYESAAYQANLQLLDLQDPASAPQTLWPSAKYTNYPQFSPDGSQLLFMSNRDNVASLFVGVPGGEARRLALPADLMHAQAHWSHDGRWLYAVQWRAGGGEGSLHGVRIDPARATVERLEALGEGITDVRDSADGRTIYFAVQDGPLMQVWRAPIDALDKRERLPLPKVLDYDILGDRLVYAEPQRPDLTVCELPEVRCTSAGLPPREGRSGFALAGDAVWVGYYDEPGEVVRFDLARRIVTQRVPHGPTAIGLNMAVSPDERRAVISRQEPPAIDLVLAPRTR